MRDVIIDQYLPWKYAESYGIKVDAFGERIGDVREVMQEDEAKREYYKKLYNIDLDAD